MPRMRGDFLIIVLSGYTAGDTVCYSGIFSALRARGISAERTAEVLQEMGVLVDDRRPPSRGGWNASSTASPTASAGRPDPGCGPWATGVGGSVPAAWRPSGVT